jgi:hypothetical protein
MAIILIIISRPSAKEDGREVNWKDVSQEESKKYLFQSATVLSEKKTAEGYTNMISIQGRLKYSSSNMTEGILTYL